MKFYLLIVFLLSVTITKSQVEDHFNDGDFTSSPAWNGDGSNFNVNIAGQLQLNALSAGNSCLAVAANLSTLDSIEWRFMIRLDFSPSSSNYARVYLTSDQSDLKQPLNGYYLQFGESLSNDAIELFRQSGTVHTSVCRATNGLISSSFTANIKVIRNPGGAWTISVDYSGSTNYAPAASGTDSLFTSANFLGLNCIYTSGNINRFYFDDFYAGLQIPDTVKPDVVVLNAESDSMLSISFSEAMDVSNFNPSNFFVDNNIGLPLTITADSVKNFTYHLLFNSRFSPGDLYTLSLTGIYDVSHNDILHYSYQFTYSPMAIAKQEDVVITEIYFEQSSSSPLPDGEFIELFNRKDSAVSITGWIISDGSSDGLIPEFRLPARSYVILCSINTLSLFNSVTNAIAVPGFPTLNNDVGDKLVLSDLNGIIIDRLEFNNNYYHNSNKGDGGWTIERIDPDFTCANENNWLASSSPLHGTPGTINSVNGVFMDENQPYLTNAWLEDSSTITLVMSEPVTNGTNDPANFQILADDGGILNPSQSQSIGRGDTIQLQFNSPLLKGIYIVKILSSVKDCPGNSVLADRVLRVGFAQHADVNDVLINELMYYCYEDGNDFLEIYNCSEKIIDLQKWVVAEGDYTDSTLIVEEAQITIGHKLLFPGDFLLLSESDKLVKNHYSCMDPFAFLNISGMPNFNSAEGRAIIFDDEGKKIDSFQYSDDQQFPLVVNSRGVSLERLSTSEKNDLSNNWHSAAATAGFATPGYRNSQQAGNASGGSDISVDDEIFSPDNDGYDDVLTVHYAFPHPGTVLSLNVYDFNGLPVRTLLSGQTVSSDGLITWDGLKEDWSIAGSGIYILMGKSFDLEGHSSVYRKAIYLTRRF